MVKRKPQSKRSVPATISIARLLLCGLMSSSALVAATYQAGAFELFGFKFFEPKTDEDTDIVNPLRYTVTLSVTGGDADLTKALNQASDLVADAAHPVSGSLGLLTKARADRKLLVAALFGKARYDGLVRIAIAGRSIDTLPPDAEFGAGPVPVAISIDPGRKFVLGDVRLTGDAAGLSPAEFGLTPGGDAGADTILKAEANIVRRLRDQGRPLADVVARDVIADHNTGRLDVTLNLAAGPVADYGRTTVTGTEAMDPDFTAYMTGLPRGQKYLPKDVDDARDRLVNMGVFSSVAVSTPGKLDANGQIPVDVTVSERKRHYYGVGATLSNTEGLGVEGYWGHRNLFGKGENLRIEGQIGRIFDSNEFGKLNYSAGIMFEKPGVVGPASKFFTGLKTIYEHPDAYDRFSVEGNAGLAYDVSRTQKASAEVVVEFSRITDAFVTDKDYLIVSTPLQYIFDNRDDRLNPTKGYRWIAYGEPAYDLLDGTTFVKFRGEFATYKALDEDNRIILAGRAVLGSIVGATVEEVPADRRFYAGGGGSVRGYAYQGIGPKDSEGQPTGGLSLAEGSAELRVAVTEKIGVVPFVDVGTVSLNEVPDLSDLQTGVGVGLRYLTPFGPLRVDAAVPLDKEEGDPDFGLYAGIGQAF